MNRHAGDARDGDSSESDHVGQHAHPQPLAHHPLGGDPFTTLATMRLPVGTRTLLGMSDGFFSLETVPRFLGTPDNPTALHDDLVASGISPARMPIGCFLWPGEKNVLIDAGYGPRIGGSGAMIGGQLPAHLRHFGFSFDDIDVVALSHLHADHTGWIADQHGEPLFRNAQVVLGRADWDYFVVSDRLKASAAHVRQALVTMAEQGRVTLVDEDVTIAPGVRLVGGPGHTPGHSLYVLEADGDRAILFGDAIYCPAQLTDTDWAASSDVDPVAAKRTREAYLRELDQNGGLAVGCHFPGLRAGRVLSGAWQSERGQQ
ncbi:Beta-lactamase domain protein (modular protein) [Frankia canadensis]|uniref:Beta-lactamase domain protein (Modular protein) n=1 Tax=Frankia canadensis TaxID=1836972 RepID=A0A2I2KHZ1_9ACTN|nr:MBL fold metallo-hydrolase [Frankia canadensis]SNQ45287.1 Beta-lactamase domain protein (modular protein) [Frankia canadensis]SOU52577.1 Beta-lactamase domain protein (modular protein) [Frankia canadensis]